VADGEKKLTPGQRARQAMQESAAPAPPAPEKKRPGRKPGAKAAAIAAGAVLVTVPDEHGRLPQPHGGVLTPKYGGPPRPVAQGVLDHREGMNPRAIRKRVLAAMHAAGTEAAKELIRLAHGGGGIDQRVQAVAIDMMMNRTLGKAGDLPQGLDDGEEAKSRINVDFLTMEEQEELNGYIQGMERLRDLAAQREEAADGE
jgi:hypothetical protein